MSEVRIPRLAAALLLWIACVSFARTPLAAPPDRARAAEHFERGLRFVDEGDVEAALVEFQTANAIVPDPLSAYNVALAYARLRRPLEAVRVLREVSARAGSTAPELRAKMDGLLAD